MGHFRSRWIALGIGLLLSAATVGSPSPAIARLSDAGAKPDPRLLADLDGRSLDLSDVGSHYCHDFDYPTIHCFSDASRLESSTATTLAVTAVDYVTVYEYTSFQGSYMHMSENYTVLAWIGWNDRISSLKVRNNQSGNFYVDWFYGGAAYGFCCNQQLTGLGSFDNSFSSVYRF